MVYVERVYLLIISNGQQIRIIIIQRTRTVLLYVGQ